MNIMSHLYFVFKRSNTKNNSSHQTKTAHDTCKCQIQFQISDHSSAMVLPCANFLYVNFPRTSAQSSPLKTTLTIGIKRSQEQQKLNHVAKSFPNRFQSQFFGGESSNSQCIFGIKSSHIYRRSNSQHIFGIKSIHIYWRRVAIPPKKTLVPLQTVSSIEKTNMKTSLGGRFAFLN